ncbi:MAG: ArdC family protein [Aquabacterium sp.]
MHQYQVVTDRIIAMLEAGTRPWHQPWAAAPGQGRPRRVDGTPYRGINTVNLWSAAMARGFTSSTWMTFKAAKDMGANVRKGAKSESAFFVGTFTKEQERDGNTEEVSICFLKAYCVFNADEIDGLPSRYYRRAEVNALPEAARVAAAETFVQATGASVAHGGARAYYRPSSDAIQMPDYASFSTAEGYYGTLLHELVHWSGAKARLDRTFGARFGDENYSAEELVAELGAAFLCCDLGVTSEAREDHAAYLASWIKAMKEDNRVIFRAAAAAEKAAGYLHGLQAPAIAEAA